MIRIEDEYFSASTNRSLGVLDIWGDVLAFGSSNAILLYNYQVRIVFWFTRSGSIIMPSNLQHNQY